MASEQVVAWLWAVFSLLGEHGEWAVGLLALVLHHRVNRRIDKQNRSIRLTHEVAGPIASVCDKLLAATEAVERWRVEVHGSDLQQLKAHLITLIRMVDRCTTDLAELPEFKSPEVWLEVSTDDLAIAIEEMHELVRDASASRVINELMDLIKKLKSRSNSVRRSLAA